MCGIAGSINLSYNSIELMPKRLQVMNQLLKHRGPDGQGIWYNDEKYVGLAHSRLSIIDAVSGAQPMTDMSDNWITFNGEIYNYLELRDQLGRDRFRTDSDTEVILQSYLKWGYDCVDHLRGMFAFAIWDGRHQTLFCARDRFGIKPFYYTIVEDTLYFASEIKALLPFIERIQTNLEGFKDYLSFQFCLSGKTLFQGIHELQPGHMLTVRNGNVQVRKYWEVYYDLDWDHTGKYFEEKVYDLLADSVKVHLRSDVPVGAYVSGGLDSSIIASLAAKEKSEDFLGFTGKFSISRDYDESMYAEELSRWRGFQLHQVEIQVEDFIENIRKVIFHLDQPVAGPGSFPQYMVSQHASRYRKVVLGGQGGDEIFGGYTRYIIAYFEQCIKAAIDGTTKNGNFIVTYESIIPNLTSLKNYKPLLQDFWREGLFDDLDKRYFRLINRATTLQDEIRWDLLNDYSPYESFKSIFGANNVKKESYFDSMTHFDFKTLLPALLHVEDRVSMAHGLESRVPFLDHPLIELVATIPSNIKFKDGTTKQLLKNALSRELPEMIVNRQDKMGFPVPFNEWVKGGARDFVFDLFSSRQALSRDFTNNKEVLSNLENEPKYSRKLWGLLSLELWQQEFHDREYEYKKLLQE
ncbi:asparagine synthase (glutamine-hydrolyzing) [Cohnella suwonensis]|uniref:asparagine synthase (glutamine-hydrolyzing) n=1 Tax=Cohnella suwonensis TaxID=696072 RepID=A0ABW0LV27_9BACL